MNKANDNQSAPDVKGSDLVGRRWKVVINGRRHLNSERYGATFTGGIQAADAGRSIYDLMHALADYLESNNSEMEHPDSFCVVFPPPTNNDPTNNDPTRCVGG